MNISPTRKSAVVAQGIVLRAGFVALSMGMTGSRSWPAFAGGDATR